MKRRACAGQAQLHLSSPQFDDNIRRLRFQIRINLAVALGVHDFEEVLEVPFRGEVFSRDGAV
jgi:hypothetical protein